MGRQPSNCEPPTLFSSCKCGFFCGIQWSSSNRFPWEIRRLLEDSEIAEQESTGKFTNNCLFTFGAHPPLIPWNANTFFQGWLILWLGNLSPTVYLHFGSLPYLYFEMTMKCSNCHVFDTSFFLIIVCHISKLPRRKCAKSWQLQTISQEGLSGDWDFFSN